jgi:predicted lipoprotein
VIKDTPKSVHIVRQKGVGFGNVRPFWYSNTITTREQSHKRKEKQMAKTIEAPTVGSQFTTAKSKVTGEVQEVVKNANGSYRVRLDVNGQPRWTTLTK